MDSLIPYQYAENRLLGNSDRVAAIEWARDLMISSDFVVFDSETTGLSSPVDFVEIAVVDPAGETLFDSLLKPSCRIEPRARAVHGHGAKSEETFGRSSFLGDLHLPSGSAMQKKGRSLQRLLRQAR